MNRCLLKLVVVVIAITVCRFGFAASPISNESSNLSSDIMKYIAVSDNDDCETFGSFSGFELGDIAFTGYLCDGAHEYSFVILVDIPAGVSINFTDRGWKNTGGFRDSEEDIVKWTSTTPLKAGTEVLVDELDASVGTMTTITGNPLTFTDEGDQIFAYKGAAPTAGNESNFIAAIHMNGEWDATGGSERTSAKPSVFTDGVNSISVAPEKDHAVYECTTTSGTPSSLRTAINDKLNWETTNQPILSLPTCGFDVIYVNDGDLPCGFTEANINCDGSTDVEYNSDDNSFNIKVDGCYHSGYGPDRAAFVYKELCGNGEMVARVRDLHGSGYAGIMARESLHPLSRKMGTLKYDSRYYVMKEWRAYFGRNILRVRSYRRDASWLKITRRGSYIRTYTSTNGSSWQLLHSRRYNRLDRCLYFGLTAYAKSADEGVSASFDNVTVTSYERPNYASRGSGFEHVQDIATSLLNKNDLIKSDGDQSNLMKQETAVKTGNAQLYPNPANQEIMIDLTEIDLQEGGLLELYNSLGQQLYQQKLEPFGSEISRLDLQPYSNGVYYLRLQLPNGETTNLPFLVKR